MIEEREGMYLPDHPEHQLLVQDYPFRPSGAHPLWCPAAGLIPGRHLRLRFHLQISQDPAGSRADGCLAWRVWR